jgi:hypothetical protein
MRRMKVIFMIQQFIMELKISELDKLQLKCDKYHLFCYFSYFGLILEQKINQEKNRNKNTKVLEKIEFCVYNIQY